MPPGPAESAGGRRGVPPTLPASVLVALDRLARGLRSHRQSVAVRHRLTPLQLELLATVAASPPPEPTVGHLARELAVSQPTVTDSIRVLAAKGLLARTADPTDRRRTVLSLTPAGKALADQLAAADRALLDAVSQLDAGQLTPLYGGLLQVIAGLVDGGVIDVARTCTTCSHHRLTDAGGHHCTLLGADLPTVELRVDCPDHSPRRRVKPRRRVGPQS